MLLLTFPVMGFSCWICLEKKLCILSGKPGNSASFGSLKTCKHPGSCKHPVLRTCIKGSYLNDSYVVVALSMYKPINSQLYLSRSLLKCTQFSTLPSVFVFFTAFLQMCLHPCNQFLHFFSACLVFSFASYAINCLNSIRFDHTGSDFLPLGGSF